MSVILEFTVDADAFAFGQLLSGVPGMRMEIERIVPTGSEVMPFVWVTGEAHEAFEAKLAESDEIRKAVVLDRTEDSVLYRIEWEEPPEQLIQGISAANATILEAHGTDTWLFHLRFTDQERLTAFHDFLTEHDIPIHIERTYTFGEDANAAREFGLTHEQREALVLALDRGYFATPSAVELDELADELGISRQAVSKRLRRGNEKILEQTLVSSNAN